MAEDRLMETVTETLAAWAKKFEEKNAEIAALKKENEELRAFKDAIMEAFQVNGKRFFADL